MKGAGAILGLGAGALALGFLLTSKKASAASKTESQPGGSNAPNNPITDKDEWLQELLAAYYDTLNGPEYYTTEEMLSLHTALLDDGLEDEANNLWNSVIGPRIAAQTYIAEHGLEPQSDEVFDPSDFPTEEDYQDAWRQADA